MTHLVTLIETHAMCTSLMSSISAEVAPSFEWNNCLIKFITTTNFPTCYCHTVIYQLQPDPSQMDSTCSMRVHLDLDVTNEIDSTLSDSVDGTIWNP